MDDRDAAPGVDPAVRGVPARMGWRRGPARRHAMSWWSDRAMRYRTSRSRSLGRGARGQRHRRQPRRDRASAQANRPHRRRFVSARPFHSQVQSAPCSRANALSSAAKQPGRSSIIIRHGGCFVSSNVPLGRVPRDGEQERQNAAAVPAMAHVGRRIGSWGADTDRARSGRAACNPTTHSRSLWPRHLASGAGPWRACSRRTESTHHPTIRSRSVLLGARGLATTGPAHKRRFITVAPASRVGALRRDHKVFGCRRGLTPQFSCEGIK